MEQNLFGTNESVFISDSVKIDCPILNQDIHVDLAIIGGGGTGITLAYLLKHSGQKIVILEQDCIEKAVSKQGVSQLSPLSRPIYHKLVHSKSPGKAKRYADISREAVSFIRKVIKNERISCGLVEVPSYVYTADLEGMQKLKNEIETCKRLEINLEYTDKLPVSLPAKAAMQYKEAALLQTSQYLKKLAEDFITAGGKIYEHVQITAIKTKELREEGELPFRIKINPLEKKAKVILETAEGFYIYAQNIVVTTLIPMGQENEVVFPPVKEKKNYHIAFPVSAGELPRASFKVMEEPSYMINPLYEKKMVLVSKINHLDLEEEEAMTCYEDIIKFAEKLFEIKTIPYYWSESREVTYDRLPYIGFLKNSSSTQPVYVAAGFNESGLIGETAAALVLKDMLLIGKSSCEELFNPKRGESSNIY